MEVAIVELQPKAGLQREFWLVNIPLISISRELDLNGENILSTDTKVAEVKVCQDRVIVTSK